MLRTKTNGELLALALDSLTELIRRGNTQLQEAQALLLEEYEHYTALKVRAELLARLDDDAGDPQDLMARGTL